MRTEKEVYWSMPVQCLYVKIRIEDILKETQVNDGRNSNDPKVAKSLGY